MQKSRLPQDSNRSCKAPDRRRGLRGSSQPQPSSKRTCSSELDPVFNGAGIAC